MKDFIAIILARKGSEAIKSKNLLKICGKPLIQWSIEDCLKSKKLKDVWVSSDCEKILDLSNKLGAKIIKRPKKFANSKSSSESAWLHAVSEVEKLYDFNNIVGIQPTSPIRSSDDIDGAIKYFKEKKLDSLFTSSVIRDYFVWVKKNKKLRPNYNYKKRTVRQKISEKYLENGSIYIFGKKKFIQTRCRLFGKIDNYVLNEFKKFQLDEKQDIFIIKSIMKEYLKKNL